MPLYGRWNRDTTSQDVCMEWLTSCRIYWIYYYHVYSDLYQLYYKVGWLSLYTSAWFSCLLTASVMECIQNVWRKVHHFNVALKKLIAAFFYMCYICSCVGCIKIYILKQYLSHLYCHIGFRKVTPPVHWVVSISNPPPPHSFELSLSLQAAGTMIDNCPEISWRVDRILFRWISSRGTVGNHI